MSLMVYIFYKFITETGLGRHAIHCTDKGMLIYIACLCPNFVTVVRLHRINVHAAHAVGCTAIIG